MRGLHGFRLSSLAEGVSLLVLVLVAMPLKYAFGVPAAVRIAGSVHGVLFLVLLSSGAHALFEGTLPRGRVARVLGLSLVPFGFLFATRVLDAGTTAPRPP